MISLVSTRIPMSFALQLLYKHLALTRYWCVGLLLPRCRRSLHCSLLNCMRFCSAHFSCLSRSPWMAAQPSWVSATPLSFVSSANLLRVDSTLSSKPLMKLFNSTDFSVLPLGAPPVNGPQLGFLLQLDFAIMTLNLAVEANFHQLPNLYFFSLSLRMLWETVLKAYYSPWNK